MLLSQHDNSQSQFQ